jgi:enoyl-CoA hydratase/carnithine racemase
VRYVPGAGGAWFLQRTVGYQRACELAFTGRLLRADEALELGIFLDVVAPGELLPRVRSFALQIAAKPPQALRLTKRLMKAAQRMDVPDLLDLTASFQALAHETQEHVEALDAFLSQMNAGKKG